MVELKNEVKELHSSNTSVQAELVLVKEGVNFMKGHFKEFKTEVITIPTEVNEAKHLVLECQKESGIFSRQLDEIKKKQLIELKPYSRRSNLELKGIPVTDNEDIPKVVGAVASRLSTRLSSHDIEIAHHVPTKASGLPNVVVRFASRTTRDRFLWEAKKRRLNASMLGLEGADHMFVNEHLYPQNEILLWKAIATKRAKGGKFSWVSGGKILIRKGETSKVSHVTCEADLYKITGTSSFYTQKETSHANFSPGLLPEKISIHS